MRHPHPTLVSLTALFALAAPRASARADVPEPSAAPEAAPLDLAAVRARAAGHSPRLAEGAAAAAAAAARADAADARRWPKLALLARYTRLSHVDPGSLQLPLAQPNGEPLPAVAFGEAVEDQASVRLTVEQPLFTGFALTRGVEAAAQGQALVGATRAVDAADLRLRADEAYYALLRARRALAVARDSLERTVARSREVAALVAAERATGLEVARMRAQEAGARAALARAEAAEGASRRVLALLIGASPDSALPIVDDLDAAAEPARGAGEGHLDAQVAEARASLRATQAEAAEAGLWPQLALRLGATWANPNERYFPPQAEWNATWDASVVLSWQFDALATVHEAEAARSDAAQARLAAEAVRERALIEATRHEAARLGAAAAVAALGEAVQARHDALTQTEALYRAGRSTLTEVLDRQAEHDQARLDRVDAQVELRLALSRGQRWHTAPAP